jgi:hypothetical protein
MNQIIRFLSCVESVFVIDETATIEKRRKDFDDWLIIAITVTLDFHNLAFAGVGHRDNASLRTADVAHFQGLFALNHSETV